MKNNDELDFITKKDVGLSALVIFLFAFVVITLILSTLCTKEAKAEDCYSPPSDSDLKIAQYIEIYRFKPKKRLKAQVKRKTEFKTVDTFTFFIKPRSRIVTASFASMGLDMSYGVGRLEDLDIALKIARGWESAEDFGSWWEGKLLFEHQLNIYQIQCEMRNHCRALYVRDKQLLTACFQELKKWPEFRRMLPKEDQIVAFRNIVTIKIS